jgi:hypothetical protein
MNVQKPQAAVPPADDSWDVDPVQAAPKAPPPSPAAPAVTPVMPPVVAPVTPAQSTISAVDLRLIVREMIDQAIAPLQMRLAELERRPMAPSSPAFVMQAPPAAPIPVAVARPVGAPLAAVSPAAPAVAAVQAAPAPYASAMAAPVAAAPASAMPAAPRSLVVPPPPLLDVKAIEMDRSIDIDVRGFDGGRRKRRMIFLFFFAVLVLFGGMFALLADSYSPHH